MQNFANDGMTYINSDLPSRDEKRKVRKVFNTIGLLLLITYILQQIVGILGYGLIAKLNLGNVYNDDGLWVVQPIDMLVLGFTPALCFLIVFLFYHLFSRQSVKTMLTTKKCNGFVILATIVIALFFQQIASIINIVLSMILEFFNIEVTFFDFEVSKDAVTTSLDLFSSIILAPIAEELFFRGIILRKTAKVSQFFAIFFSAFIFGMMHGNPYQFVGGFLIGIAFGFVTIKTGSLIPAIIGHMAVNLNASISSITDIFNEELYNLIYLPLMAIYIIAGIYMLMLLKSGSMLTFPKYTTYHKKRTLPIVITSWSFIIVMIFYIFDLVTSMGIIETKIDTISETAQTVCSFFVW